MATAGWSKDTERAALFGVGLMLLAAVFGAIDSVLVRHLAGSVHPFVMGFTRALFGLLVVLPWIVARPGILRSNYRFRHALRAALKLASLLAYFVAFATAPLADVTAIAFTSPIFVTIGAWLFLSERPRALRIAAVVIGFVGVLVVLSPGRQSGISSGLLFALLGAVLTALIQLILKPMSGRDTTEALVAWNLIAMVPIAALPAILVWATPTPYEWMILAVQGLLGAAAMGCVTRAFYFAEASLIVPVDFLRLPIVAALGFFLFGQVAPMSTWIGATVIFVAILLMARSARGQVRPQP